MGSRNRRSSARRHAYSTRRHEHTELESHRSRLAPHPKGYGPREPWEPAYLNIQAHVCTSPCLECGGGCDIGHTVDCPNASCLAPMTALELRAADGDR